MERLTRNKNEMTLWKGDYGFGTCDVQELINKLGKYEDAEQQGRLNITAAGIGGKLYEPTKYGDINEWDIISVSIGGCVGESYLCDRDDGTEIMSFDLGDIGCGMYLTRQEAEIVLKAVQND